MTTATAGTLAHRNPLPPDPYNNKTSNKTTLLDHLTYGVPTERRLLAPGVLLKHFDRTRDYLTSLGLTPAEREIALGLLRLYAYYGKLYPKAGHFTDRPGCSKRTFWRTVAKLEAQGVLERIHRYLNHLQISNAYRIDKLIVILARYLAEHGCQLKGKFARTILQHAGNSFWRTIWTAKVRLRDPTPIQAAP